MKKNYVTPSLVLLEIEIEDAVLGASVKDFSSRDTSNSGLNDW